MRTIDRSAVHRRVGPPRLWLLMVLFLFSGTNAHLVWSQASEQPTISVKAQDQPLGEVMAGIARETGYHITINDQWKVYRVNVAFIDKPLDKALKYILIDFNHAIFFGPGNQIRIVIYTPKDQSKADTGTPQIYRPEPPPEEPARIEEEPAEPQEPTAVERDEAPPEESAVREETAGEEEPAEPATDNKRSGGENPDQNNPDKNTEDQTPEAPQDQERTN